MATKWSREVINKFIVCVEQNPCIYNVQSLEYLNRTKKAQAFNEILAEMREGMPNISLDEIKKKLRNLKIQYLREKKMVDASKKSGSGLDDVYIPKLWCYDQLDFLKNHVAIRPSEDNMESSNLPSTSRGISNNSDFESTTQRHCSDSSCFDEPQRKRTKKGGPLATLLNKIDNFQNEVLSQRNTEYDWLPRLVATEMENIDPDYRPDAAWKVQCVMREYRDQTRKRKGPASSSESMKDLLEQSMDGVFDDADFD